MSDIITLARQLGHAIQAEDFYKDLQAAKTAADSDETLQNLIGEFNLKRMNINNEACKTDRNEETLRALNQEMRAVYAQIMANPCMVAYNDAKQAFDQVIKRVVAIITQSADGEDPDTTDYSEECTHDCSTCGGCH